MAPKRKADDSATARKAAKEKRAPRTLTTDGTLMFAWAKPLARPQDYEDSLQSIELEQDKEIELYNLKKDKFEITEQHVRRFWRRHFSGIDSANKNSSRDSVRKIRQGVWFDTANGLNQKALTDTPESHKAAFQSFVVWMQTHLPGGVPCDVDVQPSGGLAVYLHTDFYTLWEHTTDWSKWRQGLVPGYKGENGWIRHGFRLLARYQAFTGFGKINWLKKRESIHELKPGTVAGSDRTDYVGMLSMGDATSMPSLGTFTEWPSLPGGGEAGCLPWGETDSSDETEEQQVECEDADPADERQSEVEEEEEEEGGMPPGVRRALECTGNSNGFTCDQCGETRYWIDGKCPSCGDTDGDTASVDDDASPRFSSGSDIPVLAEDLPLKHMAEVLENMDTDETNADERARLIEQVGAARKWCELLGVQIDKMSTELEERKHAASLVSQDIWDNTAVPVIATQIRDSYGNGVFSCVYSNEPVAAVGSSFVVKDDMFNVKVGCATRGPRVRAEEHGNEEVAYVNHHVVYDPEPYLVALTELRFLKKVEAYIHRVLLVKHKRPEFREAFTFESKEKRDEVVKQALEDGMKWGIEMRAKEQAAVASKSEGVEALGLRASVSHKGAVVWRARPTDAYTGKGREATPNPQVDHCIEVQLAELALVRVYGDVNARPGTMATAQACELLRVAINDVSNLNVTTRAINQAKRGPFTAALNRLRSDSLRDVRLEQLARAGRARALVDDGTWARIERAVVTSYEALHARLDAVDALRGAGEIIGGTSEELSALLDKLGVYES